MRVSTWRAKVPSGLVIALLAVSCASPPHKEIEQARSAIDAARAAGAERFAATEYASAKDALGLATDAVAGRDYRLALNYALESREQAEDAARAATEARARLRGETEASVAESTALLSDTRARLEGAAGARIPRRTRQAAQQALTGLEAHLQKVDAAVQAEDYEAAKRLLIEVKEGLQRVGATLPKGPTAQSPRQRR